MFSTDQRTGQEAGDETCGGRVLPSADLPEEKAGTPEEGGLSALLPLNP